MTVSISRYYKAFWSVHGVLGALAFIPSLIGAFMHFSATTPDYFYPPLGDVELIALALTIASGLLSTYMVFVFCTSCSRKLHPVAPAVLFLAAFFGFCALIGLYIRFVRVVPIQNENAEVTVSVGYDRTLFVSSSQELLNLSDAELLIARGPTEDQIQKLWTANSITFVRVSLWACYTFILVCLVSVFSFGVYQVAAYPEKTGSGGIRTSM
jgi:hypothetical protein